MKVKIDLELCEGHGRCQELASELFVVDPDDKARLRLSMVPEQLHAAVEQAVRACPRHAIAIVMDSQEPLKE